jgi:hypothetical protein
VTSVGISPGEGEARSDWRRHVSVCVSRFRPDQHYNQRRTPHLTPLCVPTMTAGSQCICRPDNRRRQHMRPDTIQTVASGSPGPHRPICKQSTSSTRGINSSNQICQRRRNGGAPQSTGVLRAQNDGARGCNAACSPLVHVMVPESNCASWVHCARDVALNVLSLCVVMRLQACSMRLRGTPISSYTRIDLHSVLYRYASRRIETNDVYRHHERVGKRSNTCNRGRYYGKSTLAVVVTIAFGTIGAYYSSKTSRRLRGQSREICAYSWACERLLRRPGQRGHVGLVSGVVSSGCCA